MRRRALERLQPSRPPWIERTLLVFLRIMLNSESTHLRKRTRHSLKRRYHEKQGGKMLAQGTTLLIIIAVSVLVIPDGPNKIKGRDHRLEAMVQNLFNKAIDETLGSVKFDISLLRKNWDVTSSPRNGTSMTEAMLVTKHFIALVATIVKKEAKKAVDFESKREEQRRTLFEVAFCTVAQSAASTYLPQTDIPDESTNKKTYSEASEEPALELPPCNEPLVCY